MGLQLSEEQGTGLSGNYWRVMEVRIDYSDNKIYVNVALYKDKVARDASKACLTTKKYLWDLAGWFDSTTLDVLNQNPQERAYEKLKTLPEFTGATDV